MLQKNQYLYIRGNMQIAPLADAYMTDTSFGLSHYWVAWSWHYQTYYDPEPEGQGIYASLRRWDQYL